GSISKLSINDREQVLLNLRGYRTILGPVPSIVRTHRQLIDCDVFFTRVIDKGKELYREHTGNAQLRSDFLTECFRALLQLRDNAGCWCDCLCAHTIALH